MYLILDCNNSSVTYLEAVSSWKNHLTSLIQMIVSSKTGTNVYRHHRNHVCGILLQQEILTSSDLFHFYYVLN